VHQGRSPAWPREGTEAVDMARMIRFATTTRGQDHPGDKINIWGSRTRVARFVGGRQPTMPWLAEFSAGRPDAARTTGRMLGVLGDP
jgi:hypothetical protein